MHENKPMAAMKVQKSRNSAENSALAARLAREITGDVFFDAFNRGRYATDASFYQVIPLGVVVPRTMDEALRALAIARDDGRIVTPRGGGTSQCGQTVNEGIVVDFSKHLNRFISLDVEHRTCVVEPGIVLDDLNRQLKKHDLWFPVDVSTASRATIGGMAGNNSCGGRSLRYGTMRDNTLAMDATLADGTLLHFGEVPRDLARVNSPDSGLALFRDMLDLGEREAAEIATRFPKVQRRVGGYNLDALVPRNAPNNMAHLLVGSEGTLAFTTQVELKLWPVIRNKVLGSATSAASTGHGCRPASPVSCGRSPSGTGRPYHDRPRPRDRDVPADYRRGGARRSRRSLMWNSPRKIRPNATPESSSAN
jgi:FAD/FMN-containing dehydrogenase